MWAKRVHSSKADIQGRQGSRLSDPMKLEFPSPFQPKESDSYVADLGLDGAERVSAPHVLPRQPRLGDSSQRREVSKLECATEQLYCETAIEGATRSNKPKPDSRQLGMEMFATDYEFGNFVPMSDLGDEGSTQRRDELGKMAASLSSLAALGNDPFRNGMPPLSEGVPRVDMKSKHKCHECGKEFKRAHNLKIHGRLHSGDKPYGCPFAHCSKEFRWKSSIVSHLNWHRTKKGEILPGFDGTASGYDTKARREKYVLHGRREEVNGQPEIRQVAALAAAKKLERALVLETQAQARHSAALKEVEEAVAAASHAKAAVERDANGGCPDSHHEGSTATERVGLNALLKELVEGQSSYADFTQSSSSHTGRKITSKTAASGSSLSPETTLGSSKEESLLPTSLSVGAPLANSLQPENLKPIEPHAAHTSIDSPPDIQMRQEAVIAFEKPEIEEFQDHGLFDLFPCH